MSKGKYLTYDEYMAQAKADLSAYIDKKMKEGFGKYCKLCATNLPKPAMLYSENYWILDDKMTYCKYCSKKIRAIRDERTYDEETNRGNAGAAYVLAWTALIFFYGFHTQSNFIL